MKRSITVMLALAGWFGSVSHEGADAMVAVPDSKHWMIVASNPSKHWMTSTDGDEYDSNAANQLLRIK